MLIKSSQKLFSNLNIKLGELFNFDQSWKGLFNKMFPDFNSSNANYLTWYKSILSSEITMVRLFSNCTFEFVKNYKIDENVLDDGKSIFFEKIAK